VTHFGSSFQEVSSTLWVIISGSKFHTLGHHFSK
jgi:hypothetical protein